MAHALKLHVHRLFLLATLMFFVSHAWGSSSFRNVSTFGSGSSLIYNPGGGSTVGADGRTFGFNSDANGVVSSVTNGMGARGGKVIYSVQQGALCTDETAAALSGSGWSNFTVHTIYDGQGRPVSVTQPGPNGHNITESWSYSDAQRQVTYTPPTGGAAVPVTSTLSADGSTLTIKRGSVNYLTFVRAVQGGQLTWVSTLNDDSGGGSTVPTELHREAVDPAGGTVTVTERGLSANAVTVSAGVLSADSTVSISGGLTNDNLTLATSGGLPSSLSGTANGLSINLDSITSGYGAVNGIGGTIAGQTVGLSLDPDGRLTSLSGPGTSQSFTYPSGTTNSPGFTVNMSDGVQGTHYTRTADSNGHFASAADNEITTLTASTSDSASGLSTQYSGAPLTINTNFQGQVTSKAYALLWGI